MLVYTRQSTLVLLSLYRPPMKPCFTLKACSHMHHSTTRALLVSTGNSADHAGATLTSHCISNDTVLVECFISAKWSSSRLCVSAVSGVDLMLRCTCEPALTRREAGTTSLMTLPQTSLCHANTNAPSAKLILVARSSLTPMIWQSIDWNGLQLRYLHMPLRLLIAVLQLIWSQNYAVKGCTGRDWLPSLKSILYVFHFRILSGSLENKPAF